MRTFGNSLSSVRGAVYFVAVLWLALFVTFAWLDRIHVDLLSRLTSSFMYSAGIAFIPLVFIVPTCAFALHVDASSVSHVFLGRFIISRRSLDDLRAVEIATGWGAVLRFDKQKPIRFLGASLPELRSLCIYLSDLRPDQISFLPAWLQPDYWRLKTEFEDGARMKTPNNAINTDSGKRRAFVALLSTAGYGGR